MSIHSHGKRLYEHVWYWARVRFPVLVLYVHLVFQSKLASTGFSPGTPVFLMHLQLGFWNKSISGNIVCLIRKDLIVLAPIGCWYGTASWYPYIPWVICRALQKTKSNFFILIFMIDAANSYWRALIICSFLQEYSIVKEKSLHVILNANTAFLVGRADI